MYQTKCDECGGTVFTTPQLESRNRDKHGGKFYCVSCTTTDSDNNRRKDDNIINTTLNGGK